MTKALKSLRARRFINCALPPCNSLKSLRRGALALAPIYINIYTPLTGLGARMGVL